MTAPGARARLIAWPLGPATRRAWPGPHWFLALRHRAAQRRDLRRLLRMEARMLDDIGLGRDQIAAALRRF